MAHERETWLDHGAAELLLRGGQVETADMHTQARADRLARVLEEIARATYAGRSAGGNDHTRAPGAAASGELPGEAAALAAYRQAVRTAGRTAGRTASSGRDAETDVDGIGTVRLGPEHRGIRIPRFGRPLRLGLVAAMAGCALSGVAAGAGYLYAPSAGESSPRPANSVSGAVTPEPLVSESPSADGSPSDPDDTPGGTGTGSIVPGATGSGDTTGTSGGPEDKHKGEKGRVSSGNGRKGGDGEKWYAQLVQACHDYRNGTIALGKKQLLEGAAKGPEGVARFCDQLLSDGPGGDGHYEGADGHGDGDGGGDSGGGGGSGGGDGPQSGGPIGGGSDGGGTGGPIGGGTGGSDGEAEGAPGGWPGGEYGETIGMNPPTPSPTPTPEAGGSDGANPPPLLPAVPGGDQGADPDPDPAPGTSTGSNTGTGNGESADATPTPDPTAP